MKVKVFSTQMGEREVETTGTTWGDLQIDLKKNGISFEKMKAVIGESKLTLEADGAMLPVQGFTLFLMNKKTKAGAKKDLSSYKYGDLRGTVRVILHSGGEKANKHFNDGGNYTTKKGDVLNTLLNNWKGDIPELEDVKAFIAEANANKGKKPAPKRITVTKNEVAEPKRGFEGEEASSKKEKVSKKKEKAPVEKAVEEVIEEKASTTVTGLHNVVEAVAESKAKDIEVVGTEVVVQHEGLLALDTVIDSLSSVDISDLSKKLQKKVKKLSTATLIIWEQADEIHTEAITKAKKKAEKAAKEAKEKAEAEAKEAKEAAEKEAKRKEARVAEEKVENEKKQREAELRSEFDDLKSQFSDVKF